MKIFRKTCPKCGDYVSEADEALRATAWRMGDGYSIFCGCRPPTELVKVELDAEEVAFLCVWEGQCRECGEELDGGGGCDCLCHSLV